MAQVTNDQWLKKIHDLLLLIAEPQLAKRDESLRLKLREMVGKSKQKLAVVLLLDGDRTQAELAKSAGMDPSNLSKFLGALRDALLLDEDSSNPKLVFPVTASMFEGGGES
jgi:hypothetical protein